MVKQNDTFNVPFSPVKLLNAFYINFSYYNSPFKKKSGHLLRNLF